MAVPLKFQSVEELQEKIDSYFQSCHSTDDKGKDIQIRPYTITGLANHLDTNRQTLLNYEEKEAYFDTIKKAKSKCEQYVEEYLFVGKNTAGGIFNLVNNYGWQNKMNTELTGKDGKDLIPPNILGMQIKKEDGTPILDKKS